MPSLISFWSVRISGMKSSVTPYAALGVGLAVVLTIGLGAIGGMVAQPSVEIQNEAALKEPVEAAPALAPSAPPEGAGGDASMEADTAMRAAAPGEEEAVKKMQSLEQEQGYMTTEPPEGPFSGLSIAIPYIAAGVVGSVVFIVARKRAGL
jgi:hypothetical protein